MARAKACEKPAYPPGLKPQRLAAGSFMSGVMHEACLLLFLHRYNRERAILLK